MKGDFYFYLDMKEKISKFVRILIFSFAISTSTQQKRFLVISQIFQKRLRNNLF